VKTCYEFNIEYLIFAIERKTSADYHLLNSFWKVPCVVTLQFVKIDLSECQIVEFFEKYFEQIHTFTFSLTILSYCRKWCGLF